MAKQKQQLTTEVVDHAIGNFNHDLSVNVNSVAQVDHELKMLVQATRVTQVEIGARLLWRKDKTNHGGWLEYLESIGIKRRTASKYMAAARQSSITAATKALADPDDFTDDDIDAIEAADDAGGDRDPLVDLPKTELLKLVAKKERQLDKARQQVIDHEDRIDTLTQDAEAKEDRENGIPPVESRMVQLAMKINALIGTLATEISNHTEDELRAVFEDHRCYLNMLDIVTTSAENFGRNYMTKLPPIGTMVEID